MSGNSECVVLLDNGSLRPEAVLRLRGIAASLSEAIGTTVHPVSLLHSSKIDPERLGGEEAVTWRRFLRRGIEKGITRFRVLPLFFGPSSAIKDYLPKVTAEVTEKSQAASVSVAETLVDITHPGDVEVAELLADFIIQKLDTEPDLRRMGVVMVDHGSPLAEVAACRDLVAAQLQEILAGRVEEVIAASMERREGSEYDFNEPLLGTALEAARERGWETVLLSYLFFSPGRHAGPGGDIDGIVADSQFARDGGRVISLPLVGESEKLIPLLAKRYAASLNA